MTFKSIFHKALKDGIIALRQSQCLHFYVDCKTTELLVPFLYRLWYVAVLIVT